MKAKCSATSKQGTFVSRYGLHLRMERFGFNDNRSHATFIDHFQVTRYNNEDNRKA